MKKGKVSSTTYLEQARRCRPDPQSFPPGCSISVHRQVNHGHHRRNRFSPPPLERFRLRIPSSALMVVVVLVLMRVVRVDGRGRVVVEVGFGRGGSGGRDERGDDEGGEEGLVVWGETEDVG